MGGKYFAPTELQLAFGSAGYKYLAATRLSVDKSSRRNRLASLFGSVSVCQSLPAIPFACRARRSELHRLPIAVTNKRRNTPTPLHNPLGTVDQRKQCQTVLLPSLRADA